MLKNKKLLIALSLIPQYLLVKFLSTHTEFIETYYSNGFYQFISKSFRYSLGWMPFSFGDIVYTLGIVYSVRWFYKSRKHFLKQPKKWLIDVFATISIIYFSFHIFWGFNYYRQPLHENLNLEADYTTEQLIAITELLIEKTNKLHSNLVKDDSLKVDSPYKKSKILELAPDGYKNLKKAFPHLKYHPESVKKSLYSYPLTYMGFSGYLNPFTNEAQVDGLIPVFKFPTTTAHEVAHQLGYAAENEANFLAFLATSAHKDPYIKYCGYAFGLRFCINEIYARDECLFEDMLADVNEGIQKNYKETRDFWEAHANPFEPFFKIFYGNFLKANNQIKGMDSYSYVVALLVNYIEANPIED